jgi:hypothetical protein
MVEWIVPETEVTLRNFAEPNVYELPPGLAFEFQDGTLHLTGTINDMRGMCDCCTNITMDEVVKRYAVIDWKPEGMEKSNEAVSSDRS